MAQQGNMQYRPTPGEMMAHLERSMTEIDQMMEQLRLSIRQAPGAESSGQNIPPTVSGQADRGFSSTPREQMRQSSTARPGVQFTPPQFSPHIQDAGMANFDAMIGRRPHLVPDRFDGRTPVEDYLHHFEACAGVNGWTKREAVQFLAASLRGPAVKLLTQQPGVVLTYDELVYRLRNRFGLGGKAEVYLAELRQRRRQPKESLQELGQRIRELCGLAYPEFDEKGQDRLARGHFLDAIVTPEIREGLFRAQPRTLDDAVEAALNTEAFLRMEGQRNEVKRATRYSRALEEQECEVAAVEEKQPRNPTIDKIVKAVIDALDERDKKKETKIRTKYQELRKDGFEPQRKREEPNKSRIDEQEEQRCFNCNGLGHWRNNCPYPKKIKGRTAAFQIPEREMMSEIKEKEEQIRVGTTLDRQDKKGTREQETDKQIRVGTTLDGQDKKGIREQETDEQIRVEATLDGQEKRGTKEQEKEEQTRVGATLDTKRKGLYLQGKVNGQDLKLLVDTGATNTLIGEKVFDQIEEIRRPELLPVTSVVLQADGSQLRIRGKSMLEVQIGDIVVTTMATVASLKNEGILGLDFLVKINAVLDCQKMELRTNYGIVPCLDSNGESFCRRIVAGEDYSIPPGHEMVLAGRVTGRKVSLGDGLVEPPANPTELIKKGLIVARSVVKADEDVLPARVFNPTKEQRIIKAGTAIASLSGLEEVSMEMIEPVTCPWASNIVLVKKKDGSQRLCFDYRQLNAETIKDASPLPRIDNIQEQVQLVETITGRHSEEIADWQKEDKDIRPIYTAKKLGNKPDQDEICTCSMASRHLLEHWDALELTEDSTCRLVRIDPVPPDREDRELRLSRSLNRSLCRTYSRSPRQSERGSFARRTCSRSPRRRSRTPQKDVPKSSVPDCPKSPQPDQPEVSPVHGRNSTPEPEDLEYDERYASRKVVSEMPSTSDSIECTGRNAETQTDNPRQRIQAMRASGSEEKVTLNKSTDRFQIPPDVT
ncbi:uncharacterized protein LOC121417729 [Lytechinus variegatus]|uniref:uncharacterized protein LOC121417729 n=1 Tax=Lytechinus variegatus TaxID=7654 RepID=UPI001BB1EE4B|nr:uncharacterized protein LOC121417729 [Lytechinus variegatus]